MQVSPEEYQQIDLRAHSLLADVPLHDVWRVELPGGGPGRTIADVRAVLSLESIAAENAAVRFLFALRALLGRLFNWDREPTHASPRSFLGRLSAAERASSLVEPGTRDGPFRVLFESPVEALSEIENPTVHAFSVLALVAHGSGHRLYWAIYVRPVGRVTAWYMRLIDPFRRWIIYPAVLRHVRKTWAQRVARNEV